MPTFPTFPGTPRSQSATASSGYQMTDLWKPGSNGSQVTRVTAATNDYNVKHLYLWELFPLTAQEDMGDAELANGALDTITRTTGSFLTDGWKYGDVVVIRGATTPSNDGRILIINNASATELEMNNPGFYTPEELPADSKIYRAMLRGKLEGVRIGEPGTSPDTSFGSIYDFWPAGHSLTLSSTSLLAFSLFGSGGGPIQLLAEGADY